MDNELPQAAAMPGSMATTTRNDDARAHAGTRQLDTLRKVTMPDARRVDERHVFALARRQLTVAQLGDFPHLFPDRPAALPDITPVMELTARHPWQDSGHMDAYHPGRWDTGSDLVFMSPIVQTGPSVGEWDGTVIYVACTAPTTGAYLVAATFATYSDPSVGLDVLLRLNGPWGNISSTGPTTEASGVTALWNGTAGQHLFFSVTCSAGITAYLQSVRLYPLG